LWPVITRKKDALPEADEFKGKKDKMDLFSKESGEGD
jgi:ferredoxin